MRLEFSKASVTPTENSVFFTIETKKSEFGAITQFIHDMKDKPYILTAEEKRNKRSLNANSYAWVLINKIADVLKANKEDVYLELLKRYGQSGVVKIKDEDVEKFKRAWKYNEELPKLKENECTFLKFWVGSSNYNSKEMSIFIEGIVSEAKGLDIETLTPEEIAKLEGIT